ncbi:MAG: hypothetical protein NTX50_03150 [Candidatus Sumerlaeota bacterium]|nr:hypothetical protein [Candidatus Sumerlaeota bacterium]
MIYFDVGTKLYENPKTQALGVMLRGIQRFFNADFPYRDLVIENVFPKTMPGNKPGGWNEIRDLKDLAKQKAIDTTRMVWGGSTTSTLDCSAELNRAEEFKALEIVFDQYHRTQFHVKLFFFRLPGVDDAKSVMRKYKTFKDLQPNTGGYCSDYRALVPRANVIICICANQQGLVARAGETFWGISKLEELPQLPQPGSKGSPAY